MSLFRQLANQTLMYGVSSVLGRVLNYLLVPLYSTVFIPADYAIITELYAYVAFLNILFTYGLETAYFRFATKSDESSNIFNITQTSLLVSSVALSGLLFLLADPIAGLLEYPDQGQYIQWLAIILGIDAILAVPFARLRLEGKALKFASLKIFNILINIGLNLLFLVVLPYSIESGMLPKLTEYYDPSMRVGYVFLSNLVANALLIPFFFGYFRNLKPTLGKEWSAMLIYAAPLMIMGFAGVTNEMFSRALLKYLLPEGFYPGKTNLDILGIFGACYKLSVFMTLAVQAFRYAFEPFFFSKSKDKNSNELFAKTMHGFILFGSFSWLVLSVFMPDIAPIFLRRESYLFALDIVPWLLGGGLFLGIYYNLSVWYKLTDQTKYGAYLSVGGAIITVLFNILLIPVLGYIGSAITTLLSYLLMTLASYFIGKKHYPVPYYTGRGSFYIILTAAFILPFYFCALEGLVRYLLASLAVGAYLLAVWLMEVRTGFIKLPVKR
ncbi:polysaccharide biosynthesis C-terminal domain-containing protein [Marinoscillum sp. MHG1-6]|uniref:oligosaccharide flippase family protein n=1 Tax=Marinoscillum sp. MHG1-6 TaxID=2959627 RepID=UPI00215825D6|nr:polysaccharide biosynthesis C-terminal domain-containing protein [Marinoscillum sp. MHG1-6]